MNVLAQLSVERLTTFAGRQRRAWRRLRSTRRNFARNDLLGHGESRDFARRVRDYWRNTYGKAVNPLWHVAIAKVTGIEDVRYVPQDIWFEEILPHFNSMRRRHAYLDKNLARTLLRPEAEVASLLKRMHGVYYTNDDRYLTHDAAERLLAAHDGEVIVKGATSDNGDGVRLGRVSEGCLQLQGNPCTLRDIERMYGGDFAIQPRFIQHPEMAAAHPSSVNTLRVLSFRWQERPRVLLTFARFGVGGKVTDNAGTGGICRAVTSDGRLDPVGVDANGKRHAVHPTSGHVFRADERIPGYQSACDYALALHERLFHFDLVSWDFVIDPDERPHFLEMNFKGASYIYQFACRRPIFGDLTDEVLQAVRRGRG